MIPFDYQPRTRIVFGPGKVESLGALAGELGLTPEACAEGILEIWAWNQANAIRQVTVRRGIDVRDLALCAFGGSGPLQAARLLAPRGRFGVIAFHSLEDRLVKHAFRRFAAADPAGEADGHGWQLATRKPVRPSDDESPGAVFRAETTNETLEVGRGGAGSADAEATTARTRATVPSSLIRTS